MVVTFDCEKKTKYYGTEQAQILEMREQRGSNHLERAMWYESAVGVDGNSSDHDAPQYP